MTDQNTTEKPDRINWRSLDLSPAKGIRAAEEAPYASIDADIGIPSFPDHVKNDGLKPDDVPLASSQDDPKITSKGLRSSFLSRWNAKPARTEPLNLSSDKDELLLTEDMKVGYVPPKETPAPKPVPYDLSQDTSSGPVIEHKAPRKPFSFSKLLSGVSGFTSKPKPAPMVPVDVTHVPVTKSADPLNVTSTGKTLVRPPVMETSSNKVSDDLSPARGPSLASVAAGKIREHGIGLLNRAEAAGKSLRDSAFVREVSLNTSVAMAATSLGAGKFGSNLLKGVKFVGKTLADPNFISRTGLTIAAGMAARAATGAVFGVSLVPAALTGAVVGVTLGHIQDEYKKSIATPEPKPEIKGFFNKAAAAGKDAWNLTKFSVKKDSWKNFGHHLAHEKRTWMTRAVIGGGLGALGGWMAGGEHGAHAVAEQAVNAKTSALATHSPVVHAPTLDTADLTSSHGGGAVHIAQPPLSAAEAQAMKDHAVELYNGIHGVAQDKAQALAEFRQAAEAGNHQAARDLFKITGEHVGPHVAPVHVDASVATPAPTVTADIPVVDAAPAVTATNDTAKAVVEAGLATAGTTAIVAGAATAAPTITAGAMALQLNAAQPTPAQIVERARIERVETLRSQGIALSTRNLLGLKAITCDIGLEPNAGDCSDPKIIDMQDGDFPSFRNPANGQEVAVYMVKPEGGTECTYAFTQRLLRKSFNEIAVAIGLPPTAVKPLNDNDAETEAGIAKVCEAQRSIAMKIAYGR